MANSLKSRLWLTLAAAALPVLGLVACTRAGSSTPRAPTPASVTATPEPCSAPSVPLVAGLLTLVDSNAFDQPQLGTSFRFRGADNVGLERLNFDVYIYPGATWSPPAGQAEVFLQALEVQRREGRIASFTVVESAREPIHLAGAGPKEIVGHMVRLRLTMPRGEERESYFAVFPDGERYVKFRATYDPSQTTRDAVAASVRQILSARVARPAHCPR